MINTNDFRTKSVLLHKDNVTVDGYWPIALDVGYSSVKGFSPNSIFAFPSYAKNLGKNPKLYGELEPYEILYRDGETGEIWRVGRSAQKMISERDTGDSQMELYGRDRYFSKMFKIIMECGLAFGLLSNPIKTYHHENIQVQTGLPPAYLEEDRQYLLDVLATKHAFSIKTPETRQYINFDFELKPNQISVMSQPEGTLMSVAMDENAATIQEAKMYFRSNLIIFDAGFGTLDIFDIKNRTIRSKETFGEFGMRRILEATGQKIKKEYGVNIQPSAMQNFLEAGTFPIKSRQGIRVSSKHIPFDDYLQQSAEEICDEAIEKMLNIYSGLFDYRYLILTGGTSAAWETQIKDRLSEIEGLSVITGNVNCPDLDLIFTNVRGYYMYLINALRRKRG